MDKEKRKMSHGKFMAIWIPIVAFLIVFAIAATVACNVFGIVLDTFLGRGAKHTIKPQGTENWDTDYYNQLYTDSKDAKAAALAKLTDVCDEGMILLKNNGVLPLDKGSAVTPFGKGYKHPVYNALSADGSIKYTSPTAADTVTPAAALAEKFTVISAAADKQPDDIGRAKGMWTNVDGSWVQPITYAGYPDSPAALPGTTRHDIDSFGGDNHIPELDVSVYGDIPAQTLTSIKQSTGLVFITRAGNEGADKKSDGYTDGTPHYLALSANEKDMIAYAKENCGKVVIVVVSSNPVELNPVMGGELEADAIVWAGHPGDNGFLSLAKILCGEVNPSGRTVDLFASDFTKTPSYKNWGDFMYENATAWETATPHPTGKKDEKGRDTYHRVYVEYEEGMYNGYRYYETAHDLGEDGFVYGELDGYGAIKTPGQVAYPFGYGLSYTDFTQTIESFSAAGDAITVRVKVTNDGERAGKEVVQIYYNAPYTELDRSMKIEKPTANLVAFAKTDVIEPTKSETVELTFSKEEMASYCYTRENPDGSRGCYMLEEGDYEITARRNSHDAVDSRIWHNETTIWFDSGNPRRLEKDMQSAMDENGTLLDYPAAAVKNKDAKFIAATNLFPYMSDYMNGETIPFTRADWKATFPGGEPVRSKNIKDKKYIDMFGIEEAFDSANNPLMGNVEGSKVYTDKMPNSKQKNDLSVLDMRGKDYYDDNWELLLDQIDWEGDKSDIIAILCGSNYFTNAVSSIGLPASNHCEGANGVRVDNGPLSDGSNGQKTVSWCMAPLMASTWNTALMTEMGAAMGQEALTVDKQGRYSPAFNLHRSPFQGRVFEYYSEDPVLSGKIAAAVVSGTANAGMFDYIKHFGLNDQETNRQYVLHTWATEQVVREIYNRPFEICIREARKTIKYTADENGTVGRRVMRGCSAMMVAQNAFGPTIAFANYDLVTRLIRDEWGFTGIINGDMFSWPSNGLYELFIRAGCDSWLAWNSTGNMTDYESATARTAMRDAMHHVAFTIANSSVLQNSPPGTIIYYDMSPWRIWLIVLNVVVYTAAAVMVTLTVLRLLDGKKHPGKYKNKRERT